MTAVLIVGELLLAGPEHAVLDGEWPGGRRFRLRRLHATAGRRRAFR